MSFLAARSAALLRRGAAPLGRRMMSGDAAEAAIEMAKWTKYSYGALAFRSRLIQQKLPGEEGTGNDEKHG